ncbi:hypothetical protein GYH30_056048 [Glycine max]|uniref:Uncharacterized protein n=1 Tax=Glycine max TaxID=3847 RepID=K7N3T6_SOYBN|nr:hypothetical protein GYH30_056048 [Glycine max]
MKIQVAGQNVILKGDPSIYCSVASLKTIYKGKPKTRQHYILIYNANEYIPLTFKITLMGIDLYMMRTTTKMQFIRLAKASIPTYSRHLTNYNLILYYSTEY